MKINSLFITISASLPFTTSAVLAAPTCVPDEGVVAHVSVEQSHNRFQFVREIDTGTTRLTSNPIAGVLNARNGLRTGSQGFPVVASYATPAQQQAFALWFEGRNAIQVNGLLHQTTFAPPGKDGVLVSYTPNPTREPHTQIQTIYANDGRKLAERRLEREPEAYLGEQFSATGDVLFTRPAPAMSNERKVVLYDPGNFQPVAEFGLDGEVISDVVVIDRDTAFFTARGGVFRVERGRIESIGEPGARIRHERLDVDLERGRVLAFGSGGHQVFTLTGKLLSKEEHGKGHASVEGFSHDGLIVEGAVHRTSPYRLRDPLTAAVVAEWPEGQAHPLQAGGERIACVSADRVVIRDDNGTTRVVAMRPRQ